VGLFALLVLSVDFVPAGAAVLVPTSSDAVDCNINTTLATPSTGVGGSTWAMSCYFQPLATGDQVRQVYWSDHATGGGNSINVHDTTDVATLSTISVDADNPQAGYLQVTGKYGGSVGSGGVISWNLADPCGGITLSSTGVVGGSGGVQRLGVRCHTRQTAIVFNKSGYPNYPPDSYSAAASAATQVQPAGIDCSREFFTDEAGKASVRVIATLLNPSPGGTDVLSIRLPWLTADTPGAVAVGELPDVATMPTGGWRGLCKDVRTVNAGWTGSRDSLVDGTRQDVGVTTMPMTPILQVDPNGGGLTTYFISGGALTGVGAGTAGSTGFLGALEAGVVAAAGAWAGWTVSGYIAGATRWGNDDHLWCEYNSGYYAARQSYCDTLLAADADLRAETQLRDAQVNALTATSTTAWATATTVAEVLINPIIPAAGARTTSIPELPVEYPTPDQSGVTVPGTPTYTQLTPTQQAAVQAQINATLADPATGTERAQAQQSLGTTQTDPRPTTATLTETANPTTTQPTPDLAAGCDQSFWSQLNPLNIGETMGCILKKLFIPTDASGITGLFNGKDGKIPFQVADVALLPAEALSSAAGAVSGGGCFTFPVPNSDPITIVCSNNMGPISGQAATILGDLRTMMVWAVYFSAAAAVIALLAEAVKH
jgi:hypothetical protein